MATAGLAGAVAQWPIGGLLDRLGRRFFPAGGIIVSAAFGIASATTNTDHTILLCAFLAVFGAASFLLCRLALAHANDLVNK